MEDGRYTRRHDAVLKEIVERIEQSQGSDTSFKLWADLPGFDSHSKYPSKIPSELREKYRPDILIQRTRAGKKELIIIELTCPFEDDRGLVNAHQRKTDKYEDFVVSIKTADAGAFDQIRVHCVEVGSRGHIASSFEEIRPFLTVDKRGEASVEAFLRSLGRTALRGSIFVYRDRDRPFGSNSSQNL